MPVDIASPGFKADPFPFYARLRAEGPVGRVPLGRETAWLVGRYDDVAAVLRDDRFAKDRDRVRSPGLGPREPWLASR